MRRICILGGGLTGLAACRRLEAEGEAPLLFEKQDRPGGWCRSIEKDGFVFDYTGHLFHVSRNETLEYLKELHVLETMKRHQRAAAIWIDGHVTPYPIQINTWGLAPEIRKDCLLGFIRAWRDQKSSAVNFRQWVLERFGDGLARHFFFPYNEKLYRIACGELSLDWVGRYVPRPSLEEVVDGALGLHGKDTGYNAHFWYPENGGIAMIANAMAKRCRGVRPGTEIRSVDLDRRVLETSGGEKERFSALISTIPLPQLVDLLPRPLPDALVEARTALRWVRVLNIALGVEGEAPVTEHWLYFPSEGFPFYRVGFPSNHGNVAPEGCHTVSVEISLDPSGTIPDVSPAEQLLEEIGLLDRKKIRVRLLNIIDPAYVVYDHARRRAMETLVSFFLSHGIFPAGRWAEWKYSAMEDALHDGIEAAERAREWV